MEGGIPGFPRPQEKEEHVEDGPAVATVTEWGGTVEQPRKADKLWYRTFLDETPPDEGLIIRIGKRPRTKKGEEPFPTFRGVQRNPAGVFWAKLKQGRFLVESEEQFMNRWKYINEQVKEQEETKNKKK